MESIASQVRQEQDLRAEADKELGRGLREQIQGLEKHLGKISDQLAGLDREFTDRLGHEIQGAARRNPAAERGTRATIERMFAELSNVKTDRNLLAGLFVEIARCLNQDMTSKAAGAIAATANVPEPELGRPARACARTVAIGDAVMSSLSLTIGTFDRGQTARRCPRQAACRSSCRGGA